MQPETTKAGACAWGGGHRQVRTGVCSLSVLRRSACTGRTACCFQPPASGPPFRLLPPTWVLLSPSLLPSICANRQGLFTCRTALLSWDLLISRTALVADDSAMRHTHVLGRASFPSRVIGPHSGKGHDGASTQPAPGGDHTLGHLCTPHWQGVCHTSSALYTVPAMLSFIVMQRGCSQRTVAAYSQWH